MVFKKKIKKRTVENFYVWKSLLWW